MNPRRRKPSLLLLPAMLLVLLVLSARMEAKLLQMKPSLLQKKASEPGPELPKSLHQKRHQDPGPQKQRRVRSFTVKENSMAGCLLLGKRQRRMGLLLVAHCAGATIQCCHRAGLLPAPVHLQCVWRCHARGPPLPEVLAEVQWRAGGEL